MDQCNTLYKNQSEVEGVQSYIQCEGEPGKSPLHQTYVAWFNAVDLADCYYAKVGDGHRIEDWHTKLCIALLKLGVVNVYARSISTKFQNWINFRTILGEKLSKLTTIE